MKIEKLTTEQKIILIYAEYYHQRRLKGMLNPLK